MAKRKIIDIARIVRSKNSGPFELTLDVFFKDEETYAKAKERAIINSSLIQKLYNVPEERVLDVIWYDVVLAVKATIARPVASGAIADTDVYGAQQHMPLLNAEVEWE